MRNAENAGFARGSEPGHAPGARPYVLLLNTDTVVFRTPSCGSCGSSSSTGYGGGRPAPRPPRRARAAPLKRFPKLATALWFGTPLERWFPRSRELEALLHARLGPGELARRRPAAGRVPAPAPAACSNRWACSTRHLWLFYNDVDLSKRIRAAGWKTRYLAEARVCTTWAARPGSTRTSSATYTKDRLRYYRKHHGWFGGAWLKSLRVPGLRGLGGAAVEREVCAAGRTSPCRPPGGSS